MRGSYTFKYHGILKNFDIQKINRDTFPKLIASNIFDVKELSDFYKSKEDYFGLELDDIGREIDNFYLFNKKEYHLKKNVIDDMFDYCEFKCESHDELDNKIVDLELNLNMQVSQHSQIKYLKSQIVAMNQNMIDTQYYLLYTTNRESNGYKSWFEFFSLEQIDNGDYTFIFKYLKGDRDFVPTFIKQIWQDYFLVKRLTEYCKNKIFQIERISGINEVDVLIENEITNVKLNNISDIENKESVTEYKDIRKDIFKDENSRMLFDFVVEKWNEKKNTSFYSMLYKYLQNEKKIIIVDSDSLIYRSFVIKNFKLNKFAKIQKQTTNKENNKWVRVFKIFGDLSEKFTLLKE